MMKPTPHVNSDKAFASVRMAARRTVSRRPSAPQTMIPMIRFPSVACSEELSKKVKYRKQQRGRRNGKAWRGGALAFGDYGLKAMEPAWITDRQIEAARVAITRFIKRGGKLWIRVFPDKPFTKKPAETRMGKGKGAPERWVAVVKPGRIMFEMSGVDLASATEAMALAAHKLPIKTRLVTRAGEL